MLFNLANQYAANEMFAEALNTYQVIVKNRMFNNTGDWLIVHLPAVNFVTVVVVFNINMVGVINKVGETSAVYCKERSLIANRLKCAKEPEKTHDTFFVDDSKFRKHAKHCSNKE